MFDFEKKNGDLRLSYIQKKLKMWTSMVFYNLIH